MCYSAAQQAAVKATIAAVRGNSGKHAQDLFTFFFKRYPEQINKFPHYKGKEIAALPTVPQFPTHTKAVLDEVLRVVESAHDSGALLANAKALVQSHVPRGVGSKDYEELWTALVPFLEQTLGDSFTADAKAGWQNAGTLFIKATEAA